MGNKESVDAAAKLNAENWGHEVCVLRNSSYQKFYNYRWISSLIKWSNLSNYANIFIYLKLLEYVFSKLCSQSTRSENVKR